MTKDEFYAAKKIVEKMEKADKLIELLSSNNSVYINIGSDTFTLDNGAIKILLEYFTNSLKELNDSLGNIVSS